MNDRRSRSVAGPKNVETTNPNMAAGSSFRRSSVPNAANAASCDACPSQDSSHHEVLQETGVEVDQQTDTLSRETEVREQLRFEHRRQRRNALDLDDDAVFDDQIDLVFSERTAFVVGGYAYLSGVGDSSLLQFDA